MASPTIRAIRRRNKRARINFDVKSERNRFMNRDCHKLGEYMR